MGKGLYFYSNTKGSGKTLLSIAITNELIIKYKIKSMYISVVNMRIHFLTMTLKGTFII